MGHVVRMAVQVLAGSIVAHRGAGVGVAGGDLDIAQVDACAYLHGDDEHVAEHVRVCPGDLDAGGLGESAQAAGGRVPVHLGTPAVEQDRNETPMLCWRRSGRLPRERDE